MWTRILLRYPSLCFLLLAVSSATKKPSNQPININTANSAQLQLVPSIGPSTAEKILQMRKSYGAFKSVNDLMAIRGIGPKRLEKMRKYLTVGKSAATGSNTLNLPVAPDAQKQTPTHSQNPPPHRKRRHRPSSRLKKQKNPNIALIGVSGGCPRFVVWVLQLNGSCASPPTSHTKNAIFLMVR